MNFYEIQLRIRGREGTRSTLVKKRDRARTHGTGSKHGIELLERYIAVLEERTRRDQLVYDLTDEDRHGQSITNVGLHEVVDIRTHEGIEYLQCRTCAVEAKTKSGLKLRYCHRGVMLGRYPGFGQ